MTSFDVEIEFRVECIECDEDLEVESTHERRIGIDRSTRAKVIVVKPCAKCLKAEAEKQEARVLAMQEEAARVAAQSELDSPANIAEAIRALDPEELFIT